MSQPPVPDLSVTKLLAGAGAAVTSAVIGSFFGVAGTVAGAAIGSVASTVATSLYERSLNSTRDRIRARLNAGGVDVEERPEPPRPWARWAGVSALVFLVGMLVVTGVEFVKGSSIAGTPGTSVSGVLQPSSAGGETTTSAPTTTSKPHSTKESTTRSATPEPSATVTPTRSATPTTAPPVVAPGPVVSGTAG
jgi:hypothetical protein